MRGGDAYGGSTTESLHLTSCGTAGVSKQSNASASAGSNSRGHFPLFRIRAGAGPKDDGPKDMADGPRIATMLRHATTRACVRACVPPPPACVRACMRACVRACVRACAVRAVRCDRCARGSWDMAPGPRRIGPGRRRRVESSASGWARALGTGCVEFLGSIAAKTN